MYPKPGAEYYLRISYTLKDKTLWADKGFEIAAEQFKLPVNTLPVAAVKPSANITLTQDDKTVKVAGAGFVVSFDKQTGLLTALQKAGVNLLHSDGAPRLILWRAAHRNDDMWGYNTWERFGLNELKYSLLSFKVEPIDKSAVKIIAVIKAEGKEGFAAYHTATYLIKGDGSVTVENKIQFEGLRINLARIGVRFLFNDTLDQVTYFGRGPWENYADRKTAADVGLYTLHVKEQYEYEKPMDRGNHEEVRWVKLSGKAISPLLIQGDANLLQFSALPHTDEQMFPVEYKIDLPASHATVFNLSTKTLGVGSAGCGPRPLEKYLVWSDNTSFRYTIFLNGK